MSLADTHSTTDTRTAHRDINVERPLLAFFGHGAISANLQDFCNSAKTAGFDVKLPNCPADLPGFCNERRTPNGLFVLEITQVSTASNGLTRNEYGLLDSMSGMRDPLPLCLVVNSPGLLLKVPYLKPLARARLVRMIVLRMSEKLSDAKGLDVKNAFPGLQHLVIEENILHSAVLEKMREIAS